MRPPSRPPTPQLSAQPKPRPTICSNRFAPAPAFEDIAKKYSDGPSAADGGALGIFKRGQLAKELEDKTFAMKAGEVTDVIRTKQGYVILKVIDHQMAGIPPLKDVLPQNSGRALLPETAARAPRLSHQAARRRLHRYTPTVTSIPVPVPTRPSPSKPPLPRNPTPRSSARRSIRSWASSELSPIA